LSYVVPCSSRATGKLGVEGAAVGLGRRPPAGRTGNQVHELADFPLRANAIVTTVWDIPG
jgi:hypothetical protein